MVEVYVDGGAILTGDLDLQMTRFSGSRSTELA